MSEEEESIDRTTFDDLITFRSPDPGEDIEEYAGIMADEFDDVRKVIGYEGKKKGVIIKMDYGPVHEIEYPVSPTQSMRLTQREQ